MIVGRRHELVMAVAMGLIEPRIQAFYAKEPARPTSSGGTRCPGTVRKTAQVLATALEVALREGLVTRNAAAALASPPRGKKREVPQWDQEQLVLFLGECRRTRPYRYPIFLTAIGAGMRQGELLGFRWQDLDWATGTVQVRQKLYRPLSSERAVPSLRLCSL